MLTTRFDDMMVDSQVLRGYSRENEPTKDKIAEKRQFNTAMQFPRRNAGQKW